MTDPTDTYHAWNPGLTSEIPARLMPRVTLYDPRNSSVGYPAAKEAADFCGLKPQEMVAFRASRLVVHEILIRVTADLMVPDGPSYEELGLNLRSMTARILNGHALPRMAEIEAAFEALRTETTTQMTEILERDIFARPAPQVEQPGLLGRLLGRRAPERDSPDAPELLALEEWRGRIGSASDELEIACLKALKTIVGGIVGRRGRLLADKDIILRQALNLVLNDHGSDVIGDLLEPIIEEAVQEEGYRRLPFQEEPVVMNVKGASGAGKSTIRPLQRELAERLGIPWQDFALVSPDYWRKFLLNYNSLGDDYKYAAMLTGQELEIIDKKLDRYMEDKAGRHQMPHLLIDRFRFDSFETAPRQQADGRLLSRFGDRVFMFFMITPPSDTVERAWKRGLSTGRYKAVDDLLFHNIEAYTGMPQLFFTWAGKERQTIHFEFLDNSVAFGERPRTAAFGWNGQLNVLDVDCMRSLSRYQRVNVEAQCPEEVFGKEKAGKSDLLAECIRKIRDVTFLDPDALKIVGRTHRGKVVFEKGSFFDEIDLSSVVRRNGDKTAKAPSVDFDCERKYTVGAWGGRG